MKIRSATPLRIEDLYNNMVKMHKMVGDVLSFADANNIPVEYIVGEFTKASQFLISFQLKENFMRVYGDTYEYDETAGMYG